MSELDSFFAKKDKNKKSKKKLATVNVADLHTQIDHGTGGVGLTEDTATTGTVTLKTTSSKSKEKSEKKNEGQDQKPEDEMWKVVEEPNEVDYSDLKIQSLQISEEPPKSNPNNPENTDFGENTEDDTRNKTVWKLQTATDSASDIETTPEVPPEAETQPKTPAGKYVPPSQRSAMAATSTQRNLKMMPEISNEQHFPSLAAASEAEKQDRPRPPTNKPKKAGGSSSAAMTPDREYSTPRYSAPRTGGDSYDYDQSGYGSSSRQQRSDYTDRSSRGGDYTERSRDTYSDRDTAWRTPASRGSDDAWGRGGTDEGWRHGGGVSERRSYQPDESDSSWRTPSSRQDDRRDNRDEWRRPDDRQAPPPSAAAGEDSSRGGGYVPPSRREGGAYVPPSKRGEDPYTDPSPRRSEPAAYEAPARRAGGESTAYVAPSRRDGAYVPPSQRHQMDEVRTSNSSSNQYAVLSENM